MKPRSSERDRDRRWALGVALLALMAGAACFSVGQGETPIDTYVFDPVTIQPGTVAGDGPVLLIDYPRAMAAFNRSSIAYMQRAHEIAYYAFSEWADAPPRMLEPLLIRTLDATGRFGAVVRASGSGVADLRLDTEIIALVHEFLTNPSQVRVSVRVQLYDLIEHRVLGTQVIEVIEAAPTEDAYGAVRATNDALGRVLTEIADFAVEAAGRFTPRAAR